MAKEKRLEDLELKEIEERVRREERLRKKAIVDQVLRVLGLVLATIIFLITFSMNAPLTYFAGFFGYGDPELVWKPLESTEGLARIFIDLKGLGLADSNSLYYNFIGPSPVMAIWLMTLIQIGLGVALGLLFSYYIRDLIGVIKSVFGLGKEIVDELKETVKENAVIIDKDGKKSLFGLGSKEKNEKETKKKVKNEKDIIKERLEKTPVVDTNAVEVKETTKEDLDAALDPFKVFSEKDKEVKPEVDQNKKQLF
jgi:hypothetical protein